MFFSAGTLPWVLIFPPCGHCACNEERADGANSAYIPRTLVGPRICAVFKINF